MLNWLAKELFFNRRSLVEVKMNRFSENNRCISSHSLQEKFSFAKRLRDLWQDLQGNTHWKCEQLSPFNYLICALGGVSTNPVLADSFALRRTTEIVPASPVLSKPNQENSVKTQKQTNSLSGRAMEAGETLYEVAEARATATADLYTKDRVPTRNSLLMILRHLGTAYRLGRMRYLQRRQLLEMDDRQLKDIGITREQAEHEERKPLWKG